MTSGTCGSCAPTEFGVFGCVEFGHEVRHADVDRRGGLRHGLLVLQRTGSQETRHVPGGESEDGLAPPTQHFENVNCPNRDIH